MANKKPGRPVTQNRKNKKNRQPEDGDFYIIRIMCIDSSQEKYIEERRAFGKTEDIAAEIATTRIHGSFLRVLSVEICTDGRDLR